MPEERVEQDGHGWEELSEAARRGLQRAGIHLVKAAIEIVAAIGAFLEEIHDGEDDAGGDGRPSPDGPTRIDLD